MYLADAPAVGPNTALIHFFMMNKIAIKVLTMRFFYDCIVFVPWPMQILR